MGKWLEARLSCEYSPIKNTWYIDFLANVPINLTYDVVSHGSPPIYSGIPGSAPQKYYLGGKDISVVLPMDDDKQTLINGSTEIYNGQTIMRFTKLIKEDGEIEISADGNDFLWAHGSDSTFGYHKSRSQFKMNLLEIVSDEKSITSSTGIATTTSTTTVVQEPPTAFPTTYNPTRSPIEPPYCPPQYDLSDESYVEGDQVEAAGEFPFYRCFCCELFAIGQ